MTSLSAILFFTYPEHGQANVNLAISYELALAGVDVHVASFPPLGGRISRLQELIDRHGPPSNGKPKGSVSFCECKGVTPYLESIKKKGLNDPRHPHGVLGALKSYSMVGIAMFPWDAEEYLAAIQSCKEIIAITKPDLVVIDTVFYPALDACEVMNQKFMTIVPTSIRDVVLSTQPYLAALWKYPALSSGFPFPLKWWHIPFNIYLNIRLAIQYMTLANVQKIRTLRRSLGFKAVSGTEPYEGVTCICPALVETDFPFAVIPEKILLCGPIIVPFDPLEESDPALKKWLDNGPTVVICLGSHVLCDKELAREMAGALRILLDYHQRGANEIQVLWKAKPSGDIQPVIEEIIGKEVKAGRVKVLAWLEAELVSILQHPNVVCTVHHGGVNSLHEGIWAGIPHIVLPVWYDTYDHANRAEFLNVGIFGNRTCAPSVQAEEFGKALVKVTGDTKEASMFRMSAKHLKELCKAKGNGRELASAAILKEAGVRSCDVETGALHS